LKIVKDALGKLELSDQELLGSENHYRLYVFMINTIPFHITIFTPYVAVVLGNIGCFIGLFTVYLIPILTYWKMLKNDIETLSQIEEKPENEIC